MAERTRVTLAHVAAASGVSVTTASLVLTGRARELRISEAAEQRVRSTAQELGYRRGGGDTRAGLSRTIGFVLGAEPDVEGDTVKGAVEVAYRRGFMLFVGETGGDPAVERGLVEALRDRRADGVVFAGGRPDVLWYGPAVVLGAPGSGLPSVVPDEVRGGRSAARVLVEAGHDRGVHLVGAGQRDVAAADRLAGLRQVFSGAGVEVAGVHPCPEWTPEGGYDVTKDLLRRHRPAALVCFDDRLAFGAYEALAEAGLSVPGDVSVLGFGGHPAAAWMRPRLTTVALPLRELGERAVEVLVELVEGRGSRTPLVHRVPMPVRGGGSVARAR
ncbi:LacI family DNA-binding transcriptional regulator [Lentzea albida]|uniref:Transcriptional regulator, LacI family n=1 Tax=Lentzea albida TaxID=65499 RepID=A0A1H9QWJ6_9PSEU|nr:LacI family DNA-binding transcriptional regulator [Lentzea albida]SER64083.1 transcriptional regulator, LacI family [Lentzea albida]